MDYSILKEIAAIIVLAVIIGGLYALLFKLRSSKVTISFQNNLIIFQNNNDKLELKPYLHISHERKRILSVGDSPQHIEKYYKVDLINYTQRENDKLSYKDYLSAFFRYGFIKLLNRKILVFTKVTLIGTEIIKNNFSSDYRDKLQKALKEAGAIECYFE